MVDYELQKVTKKGPEVRYQVQQVDARLLSAAQNLRGEGWQRFVRKRRPGKGNPR